MPTPPVPPTPAPRPNPQPRPHPVNPAPRPKVDIAKEIAAALKAIKRIEDNPNIDPELKHALIEFLTAVFLQEHTPPVQPAA